MIQYICDICGKAIKERETIYGVRVVPRKDDILLNDEIQELELCKDCWKKRLG